MSDVISECSHVRTAQLTTSYYIDKYYYSIVYNNDDMLCMLFAVGRSIHRIDYFPIYAHGVLCVNGSSTRHYSERVCVTHVTDKYAFFVTSMNNGCARQQADCDGSTIGRILRKNRSSFVFDAENHFSGKSSKTSR